ncbi:MAG: hypothetical protein JSW22_04965 [Chloroflexota bacterium]|nr:MAG: hypothetical protein JSW22_04965 [Chloroflexota bacterium]
MDDSLRDKIIAFLEEKTKNGLFPIAAYGVDRTGTGSQLTLLTTNIKDLPLALDALKDATQQEYNLGRYISRDDLLPASRQHPHLLMKHAMNLPSLNTSDISSLGAMIQAFGAPFFKHKAFALVDLCGFTKLRNPEQLSQLYGLANAVRSAARRCGRFCVALGLPGHFRWASTGDGYYVWHDGIGGNADVAVFMWLLCVMTHTEWMRKAGFSMRLKAAFVIDSVYLLYDTYQARFEHPEASNAVGSSTNAAARLVEAAAPSQILMANFERPGQGREVMRPDGLISQASQLFREERVGPATIVFDPGEMLRVTDKHRTRWYCWNVVADVPNVVDEVQEQQHIGLPSDPTKNILEVDFKDEP